MKQKANKYYSFILLALLVFFTGNSIMGNIAFGYGLGDVIYHPVLWIITLAFIITLAINRKNKNKLLLSNAVFTIPTIWIILSTTLWRGCEYNWNGEIFYPSKRTIEWHATNERKWKSERDSLKLLIKRKPEEIKAYTRIGELNSLLKNEKEVLNYYELAIEKGDNSARFRLAREYESLNMEDKAIIQYEEMLKIDSTDRVAKIGLRRLKKEK